MWSKRQTPDIEKRETTNHAHGGFRHYFGATGCGLEGKALLAGIVNGNPRLLDAEDESPNAGWAVATAENAIVLEALRRFISETAGDPLLRLGRFDRVMHSAYRDLTD